MENSIDFSSFIQEHLKDKSINEQEALALAIGFNPQLERKFRLEHLRIAAKNQDLIIRRAALIGLGFSNLVDPKKGDEQKKALKNYLNDPLTTTRIASAIALGINGLFSNNKKFQKNVYDELRKKIIKADFIVKQGYAIGLGLLAKFPDTQKDSLRIIFEAFNPVEMGVGNPDLYIVGLTLTAINTERAEEGVDFILETIVPHLSNKESRRIAMICIAFLLPLIPDPETRVEKLEKIIQLGIEFHSKFGTDSALILTYISLLQDKKQEENFLIRLLGFKDLDPDYGQIFTILKENKSIIDIIQALLKCNTLDIKAAGITASFFLESKDQPDMSFFIKEGLQQRGSGYFDQFLVLLRTFSFMLNNKEYKRVKEFEPFFHSNDQRVKRFAGLSYACLKAINIENHEKGQQEVYSRLKTELDEHVRWGMLVGVSMYETVGKNILDDELIIGLLLLGLGFIDVSTLLLFSQAMSVKFYQ
ncbi:MAG: HEAT repeat domain-containing protein [Candidatus Thorarchaeota archaeon]